MADLIVVGFEGTSRATQVLEQLRMLDSIWAVDLHDAVAVYRTGDGRLRVDESLNPTSKEETAWGGVLGALVGAVLFAPLAALAVVPAAAVAIGVGGTVIGATGGAFAAHDEATLRQTYGISEDFVKQVSGMVQPGQSAAFVLVQATDPAAIADQFRSYGGTILQTTLNPERASRLQATIG